MALQQIPKKSSGGLSGYSPEQLLQAALERGGAVADVASEAVHPEQGIVSYVGSKFKNAFGSFVDLLNMPNNIVAGAISQDYTISEAIKEKVAISDVLYGEPDKGKQGWSKAGDVIGRLATDIVLDPTTYIGLGATKGVFAVSSLSKIKSGKNLARELGHIVDKESVSKFVKEKALKEEAMVLDDVEAMRRADDLIAKKELPDFLLNPEKTEALSPIGEAATNKFFKMKLDSQRKGVRAMSAKQLRDALAVKFAATARNSVGKQYDSLVKKATGKTAREIEAEANIKAISIMKEADNAIVDQFINTKLLREEAENAVANMIAKKPALIETYLDKGGIKFAGFQTPITTRGGLKVFNTTILSAKRIESAVKLIPGMTLMDKSLKGLRQGLATMFDANKLDTAEGGVIGIATNWNNYSTGQRAQIKVNHANVLKQLKVTDDEYNLVRQSIEYGNREPTDQRVKEVWQFLQGIKPDGKVINSEMLRANGFFRNEFKKDMKTLRMAGVKIAEKESYYRHMMVNEGVEFTANSRKINPDAAKQRKYEVLQNLTTGEETLAIRGQGQVRLKDGKYEVITTKSKATGEVSEVQVKPYSEQLEKDLVMNRLDEAEKAAKGTIDKIKADTLDATNQIQKVFANKTLKEITAEAEDILGKGLNREAKASMNRLILRHIPRLEITTMVRQRLGDSYEEGVKLLPKIKELSSNEIKKLELSIAKSTNIAKTDLQKFIANLEEVRFNKVAEEKASGVKATKDAFSTATQDIANDMKKAHRAELDNTIGDLVDEEQLSGLLRGFAKTFQADPKGVRALLDKIIKNAQKVDDIINELDLEKLGTKLDLDNLIKQERDLFIDANKGFYKAMPITVEEARQLGITFDPNIIRVSLINAMNANKSSFQLHGLKEIGQKFGVKASEAPSFYQEVKLPGLSGEVSNLDDFLVARGGEKLVFHPRVAKQIEEVYKRVETLDGGVKTLLDAVDSFNGIFKASVTTLFPGFHFVNAFGNTMNNFLDIGLQAFNPYRAIQTANLMNKNRLAGNLQKNIAENVFKEIGTPEHSKYLKDLDEYADMMTETFFTDKHGYNWSFGEMQSLIRENVIAFNPNHVGQLDITSNDSEDVVNMLEDLFPATTKGEKAKRIYNKASPVSQKFLPYQWSRKYLANPIEEQARLMNFLTNLEKTGDPALAAYRTKMFLFDYQNLTGFEKQVMRRVMPFYTFTRKNLELHAKVLMSTPGRLAAEVKTIESLGGILGSDTLTDEEMDMLPEWMQGGFAVKLGNGKNGKKGETTILSGLKTPFESAIASLTPSTFLSGTTPLAKTTIEFAFGYNSFRGVPLDEVIGAGVFGNDNTPEVIKDFIGLSKVEGVNSKTGEKFEYWVSLRPERMHLLLNMPPTQRLLSTLKDMTNANLSTQSKLLKTITGWKVDSVDMEYQAAQREKEMQERLQKILKDAGVGYSFERFVLPKE